MSRMTTAQFDSARTRERNGQRSRRLDLAQSNRGIDLLNPWKLRKSVEEEALISLDIARDDPGHEIDRAHQHVALEHFGQALEPASWHQTVTGNAIDQ